MWIEGWHCGAPLGMEPIRMDTLIIHDGALRVNIILGEIWKDTAWIVGNRHGNVNGPRICQGISVKEKLL